jgi:hypothetical protein
MADSDAHYALSIVNHQDECFSLTPAFRPVKPKRVTSEPFQRLSFMWTAKLLKQLVGDGFYGHRAEARC